MTLPPSTEFAVRRLSKATEPPPPCPHEFINGVVSNVAAGASVDGVAQVTVTVNGSDTLACYAASYTSPTVGDVVLVLLDEGSPRILCKLQGFPTF